MSDSVQSQFICDAVAWWQQHSHELLLIRYNMLYSSNAIKSQAYAHHWGPAAMHFGHLTAHSASTHTKCNRRSRVTAQNPSHVSLLELQMCFGQRVRACALLFCRNGRADHAREGRAHCVNVSSSFLSFQTLLSVNCRVTTSAKGNWTRP